MKLEEALPIAELHSLDGFLRNTAGEIVPVREERDLFALSRVKYVEPEFRNTKGDTP